MKTLEGSTRRMYIPSRKGYVTVQFVKRSLPWSEGELEGPIPDVLVGIDRLTEEILVIPHESSATIKRWREDHIERFDLQDLKKEQARIKKDLEDLSNELALYERLGLLDEDGFLDEEKYDAYLGILP